jgi:acetyl-CoA C-acetyltransferase
MPEAVIVSACRTAVGTARKGTLRDTDAYTLARTVVTAARERAGVEGADVEQIVLGEALYGGGDIARHTAVTAGMPGAAGIAVNSWCSSGLTAVTTAAANIRCGMVSVAIAGGSTSRSTTPVMNFRGSPEMEPDDDWLPPSHPSTGDAPNRDMSITVGWNAAVEASVTRAEMDAWALRSHQRAVRATDEGRFRDEIVPVEVKRLDGSSAIFQVDEHPRRDTSLERLAGLKVLHPEIPGFSITAGNASGVNDAAAALVLTSDEYAHAHGLRPMATVRAWAAVGVDPVHTGTAPVKAIPAALRKAGITLGDVDLFEINEAFASMCVATTRLLGIDEDIVNVSGSGCSLGHPLAATGGRMLTTLVHELRRRGGGTGVAAMCAGGGMSTAVVIEVHG